MRIAVIGGYAPSLINFRGPLLREMAALGHDVHAMAPPHLPDVGPQLAAWGVNHHSYPLARRGLNPLADAATFFHLRNIVKRLRPDMVLSYTFKPVVYGSLAAHLAGTPAVYSLITGLGYAFTEASGLKRRVLFNLAKGMYRAGLRHTRGVIFQNPDDRSWFHRLGVVPDTARTIVVGGSGVDLDHFRQSPVPDRPSFLCLSRLLRSKGVDVFAEAAMRVKARHPEAEFRLVGFMETGSDVVTPGEVDRWRAAGVEVLDAVEDVRPLLSGAMVYVLPSHREGTPRSVLEALATGRPVITTDAPGCRETVTDGHNGFLVPVGDVDGVVRAIERFLAEPGLAAAMGQAGRRLAEEKYDVRLVNRAILEFMGAA